VKNLMIKRRIPLYKDCVSFEAMPVGIKIPIVLASSFLTGVAAQVRIPLPFTPVPVTAQVFAVLVFAGLLGRSWASAGQFLYLAFGLAGIGWFTSGVSGVGVTFGYLVGFVAMAWIAGKTASSMREKAMQMLLGIMAMYACAIAWLIWYLKISLWHALLVGVFPFFFLDIGKALLAAWIVQFLSKEDFV
jgi:biotin transport system substrate-specific component